MNVFWSWQSDHDGKISRHFVREALGDAIGGLNTSGDVEEADREEIILDHDRKGVPGSPDLANTILEKIGACDVFVGDATPVGKTESGKPVINSNVAIELGYALRAIGDRRLLMVMNEHFGERQSLPFDLRHKAGPIMYRLAPGSAKAEITRVKRQLTADFRVALREMLAFRGRLKSENDRFVPAVAIAGNPARFVPSTTPLVEKSTLGESLDFFVSEVPLLYLRVMPSVACPVLTRPQAIEVATNKLPDFSDYYRFGGRVWPNEFGAIMPDANYKDGAINFLTQLFLSREVWALNSQLLSVEDAPSIPMVAVAKLFAKSLPQIVAFVVNELQVKPPLRLEAGAFPVKGLELAYTSPYGRRLPSVLQELVRWSGQLQGAAVEDLDACVGDICEAFFEAAAIRMPEAWLKASVEGMR